MKMHNNLDQCLAWTVVRTQALGIITVSTSARSHSPVFILQMMEKLLYHSLSSLLNLSVSSQCTALPCIFATPMRPRRFALLSSSTWPNATTSEIMIPFHLSGFWYHGPITPLSGKDFLLKKIHSTVWIDCNSCCRSACFRESWLFPCTQPTMKATLRQCARAVATFYPHRASRTGL